MRSLILVFFTLFAEEKEGNLDKRIETLSKEVENLRKLELNEKVDAEPNIYYNTGTFSKEMEQAESTEQNLQKKERELKKLIQEKNESSH